MPLTKSIHFVVRFGHPRIVLAAILAAYFIMAGGYSWLNPVFEAPDELWHFLYVDQVNRTHALPIQDASRPEAGPRQEGSQPPLYYLLAALVASPIEPNDLAAYRELNFRHQMGQVFRPDQRNVIYHTDKENVASSPTARSVHLIRLLSVLLGAVTVLLTYAIARMVLGRNGTALAAAACVAFLPQFAFLSGAINNDNLAIAASSLSLLLLLRARQKPTTVRLVLLGLGLGICALAKLSALGFVAIAVLALLWHCDHGRAKRGRKDLQFDKAIIREAAQKRSGIVDGPPGDSSLDAVQKPHWDVVRARPGDASLDAQHDSNAGALPLDCDCFATSNRASEPWVSRNDSWGGRSAEAKRRFFRHATETSRVDFIGNAHRLAIVLGTVAIVAGWWYLRNLLLYGDFTGLNVMLAMVGQRSGPVDILGELWLVKASFWGLFGWSDVPAEAWFYSVTDALMLLALAGAYMRMSSAQRPPSESWLLASWIGIAIVAFVNWNRLTEAPQGRLVFPALAPLAIFFAWGLAGWRIKAFRYLQMSVPASMAGLSAFALFSYVVPSYNFLPVIPQRAVGDGVSSLAVDMGDYRLIGFRASAGAVHPGDSLSVDLYWQRTKNDASQLTRFVHLERPGEVIAGDDAPLPADLPPAVWSANDVWHDQALLAIPASADAPQLVDLTVGLYDNATGSPQAIAAKNSQPSLARLRLVPAETSLNPKGQMAVFGDQIALVGVILGETAVAAGGSLSGELKWQALSAPNVDYTVFVQLLGDGKVAAQYDGQPRGGRYPTSAWRPGETIADQFALGIPAATPPGSYRLIAGLYEVATGQRLGAGGNDFVDLETVVIRPAAEGN